MSPIRRALERKAAGEKFDFAARKALIVAGEAAVEPLGEIEAAEATTTPAAPGVLGAIVRRGSPAMRHVMQKAAANDTGPVDGSADLSPLDQMLLKLHGDKLRLKALQSTESKVALKRELLPEYLPWVEGRRAAAAKANAEGLVYRPGQDDVFVTATVWAIDIGAYPEALEMAAWCRRFEQVLPKQINRDLANFVTEEIAEAVIKAQRAEGGIAAAYPDFNIGAILGDLEELFREDQMFDQVRAKLQKALGLAVLATIPADAPADQTLPAQKVALRFLKRAAELDSASGCVKLIEGIERAIKKSEAPAS
ncbi:MAG: hypothetical protein EBR82_20955 [Caulobacteraceae bacterium]|nr:hypothetical protein [Caulobacteraceae bacterium]